MTTTSDKDFFATQIAQNGTQELQSGVQSPKKQADKKDDPKSLKSLLMLFNSFDTKQRGVITIDQAKQILVQKSVPTDKFDVHYKIAMPNQPGFIAFDQFLFVFGLCEDVSLDVEHKYEMCRKVDVRLIEFLKLLNNYRKKSEGQSNYNEAKKSKNKIEEIRERELQRRKKYLGILHEHQICQLEDKQKSHFQQFCNTWDQFMMDYQKTAADLIEKLQQKQESELKEFQQRNRQQLASKVRFSKQIIELQAKQKTLVKVQEYEKAQAIKREVEDLKAEELNKKQRTDEETIDARSTNLKKQQLAAINSLLQNIQKDRNDQLKQRKQDSQKLIIRNKNLIVEINHRYSEAVKRIYEALHNISLETEKSKLVKRSS